jgi:hypothetical protein
MRLLARRSVGAVVHCGDIGSLPCLEALGAGGVEAYAVAGNMDRRLEDLEQQARLCNVHFARDFVAVPIGGGRCLAATHGDNGRLLDALLHASDYAYVCHGHSHRLRDERIGGVRVVNGGALSRAARHTAAVLDTDTDELEIIDVPDEPA